MLEANSSGWSLMKTLFRTIEVAALGLLAAACGADQANSLEPLSRDATLIHSKIATVAVGVATAAEGGGIFDNFLACGARGVIDYRNTPRGRNATLSGCDVGDGVVLDGTIEVQWTSAGADRSVISILDVAGPIRVRVDGASAGEVANVAVRNVVFLPRPSQGDPPTLDAFDLANARVVIDDRQVALDSRATVAKVFRPTLTVDAIPNPGESLDALTEADLKRIAFSVSVANARLLFNETLEVARGDHSHTLDCGTSRVTVDRAKNLPRIDNTWSGCDLERVFVSGAFSSEWLEFDVDNRRVTMVLNGNMTLGGALPRIAVDRIEWSVSSLTAFPSATTISGRVVRGAVVRTFSFTAVLDD